MGDRENNKWIATQVMPRESNMTHRRPDVFDYSFLRHLCDSGAGRGVTNSQGYVPSCFRNRCVLSPIRYFFLSVGCDCGSFLFGTVLLRRCFDQPRLSLAYITYDLSLRVRCMQPYRAQNKTKFPFFAMVAPFYIHSGSGSG